MPTTPSSDPDLPPELARLRDAGGCPLAFDGWGGSFDDWQAQLRGAWASALPPDDPVVGCRAGLELPVGDLCLRRLSLHFASGKTAEGAMLSPLSGGPHPAVLMLHDHGGEFRIGWRKLLPAPDGPIARAEDAAQRYYGGFPGLDLARRGHVVLAFDAFGWGARRWGGSTDQQALACNALQLGCSLAGMVAAEDAAIARWVAAQPFAQPGGIAAWGFSFGGFRAWQLAAICGSVRAAVALSWMARRRMLLRDGNPLLSGQSAFWMLHPSLSGLADLPDLAGAAAPKPLFLRSGDADRHMPAAASEAAFSDLRRIWAASGASCDAALFAGGHVCPPAIQSEAADFLDRSFS